MSAGLKIIVVASLFAALLSGCAVFASKSDYADYREVRLATDEQQRLLAMQQYVERNPDGRWFVEIQTERQEREAEIYETYKTDRAGLEFFVRAFPPVSLLRRVTPVPCIGALPLECKWRLLFLTRCRDCSDKSGSGRSC